MLNNIKIARKKVRKFLVYLEVSIRIHYLCTQFQAKSIDNQFIQLVVILYNYRPEGNCYHEYSFRIVLTKA